MPQRDDTARLEVKSRVFYLPSCEYRMADYADKNEITQMKQTDPLTEKIIGCCFKVHKALGPGFNEKIIRVQIK